MKFAFCFNVEDHLYDSFGGRKLYNSIKYFYPNAIVDWYDSKETNRIQTTYPWSNRLSFMPCIMKDCMERNRVDRVIKIDADSLVLSSLDESFDYYFDICGVRNDGDHIGNKDESINRPFLIKNIENHKYLSCGFISTNNKDFLNEWIDYNYYLTQKYGKIENARTECPMVEQGSYNILFHSGKYKTKILDPLGGNLFYGASANMPSPNKHDIPEHIIKEWGVSNWQSWKDIKYINDKFWLYEKQCKLLHFAGGGSPKTAIKLSFDMFDPSIVPILQKITKCDK